MTVSFYTGNIVYYRLEPLICVPKYIHSCNWRMRITIDIIYRKIFGRLHYTRSRKTHSSLVNIIYVTQNVKGSWVCSTAVDSRDLCADALAIRRALTDGAMVINCDLMAVILHIGQLLSDASSRRYLIFCLPYSPRSACWWNCCMRACSYITGGQIDATLSYNWPKSIIVGCLRRFVTSRLWCDKNNENDRMALSTTNCAEISSLSSKKKRPHAVALFLRIDAKSIIHRIYRATFVNFDYLKIKKS